MKIKDNRVKLSKKEKLLRSVVKTIKMRNGIQNHIPFYSNCTSNYRPANHAGEIEISHRQS